MEPVDDWDPFELLLLFVFVTVTIPVIADEYENGSGTLKSAFTGPLLFIDCCEAEGEVDDEEDELRLAAFVELVAAPVRVL